MSLPPIAEKIFWAVEGALAIVGAIIAWTGLDQCNENSGAAEFWVTFGVFNAIVMAVIGILGFGERFMGLFYFFTVTCIPGLVGMSDSKGIKCADDVGSGSTMMSIALYLCLIIPYVFSRGIGPNGAGGIRGGEAPVAR